MKMTFWETCCIGFWIFFYKIDMPGLIPKPNEDPRNYIMDGRKVSHSRKNTDFTTIKMIV